jgi:DNA-binding transcriptional LysR family regulator
VNLHHLELFYYVAKNGGIMEAVRHMPYGIQQPAVSAQIIQLEADLGAKLFQRRPFKLTAPGEELFAFIEPFFGQVETVGERIRGGVTKLVRMGAPAPVLRDHLPAIMPQVRQQFPGLRLMLREASQSQAETLLNRQEIDFAVTVLEGKPGAGITAEPLIELPLVLLVPTATRWRSAEDIFQQDQLADSLISLAPHESMVRRFQEYLTQRRLAWATSLEVSSLDLVDVYVAGGFGVGLSCQLPGARRPTGLRVLPLADIAPLRIGALWRERLTPVNEAVLAAFKSRAAQVLTPA